MKKLILSAIAIMAFTLSNAQETRFGVKGGLNLSNFTGEANNKVRASFHIGGFAEIKVIERLAIQPELLYSSQGARYRVDGTSDSGRAYKLDYINIPVLAKFYVTKEFTVEAGPQIGFLVSAKNEDNDIKDSFKGTDYGFNFGAGYNFTDNISVGLRYTVGISSLVDGDYDYFGSYFDSVKNSNLQLSLAYKF